LMFWIHFGTIFVPPTGNFGYFLHFFAHRLNLYGPLPYFRAQDGPGCPQPSRTGSTRPWPGPDFRGFEDKIIE